MKKIISILMIIISIFTFIIILNNESSKKYRQIMEFEGEINYSYNIVLPSALSNLPQEDVYLKLTSILEKNNGNIYYNRKKGDDEHYLKYVYITDESCFENLHLEEGKLLSKSDMAENKYVDTKGGYDANKVGRIAALGDSFYLKITSLKTMTKDGYTFGGNCIVSFKDSNGINKFKEDIKNTFKLGNVEVLEEEIPIDSDTTYDAENLIVIGSLFLITMLLVLYDIMKSYKSIGVKKLMGLSTKTIWAESMKKLVLSQIIISVLVILFMSIYKFQNINILYYKFIGKLLVIFIIEAFIMLLICSIPFIYITKIKISNIIKNKQNTKGIIILNFCVKVVLITILIVIINVSINNYSRVRNVLNNSYENWDKLSDYVVIPYLSNISVEEIKSDFLPLASEKIYKYFNKEGAILAEFSENVAFIKDIRSSEVNFDFEIGVSKVNPNYLKEFNIYDSDGEKITIDENEDQMVLLVPEKYKLKEKDIYESFNIYKEYCKNDSTRNKNIKIIWTQNNQKIFSAIMEVNPLDNNNVIDPIIRVVTENNCASYDLDILGINYNPFKIKIKDGENIESFVRPILLEYGVNKNIEVISSANEDVATEIKSVKQNMAFISSGIVLIIGTIIILIIQNINNYFNQYKQQLAIREFHGYKLIHKYVEYFQLLIFNWVCVIISSLVTKLISFDRLLYISLVGLIVEVLFSLIALKFVGKRKTLSIIKGGE